MNYLKDLDGCLMQVTDLKAAITHVAGYLSYLHREKLPERLDFVRRRQKYWKDVFQKLGKLNSELLNLKEKEL